MNGWLGFIQVAPIAIILTSSVFLADCATIAAGSSRQIEVTLPPQTLMQNHSRHDVASITAQGQRSLVLTAGEEYLLDYAVGSYHDSVVLRSKLIPRYLIGNVFLLFLAFPVGVAIDMGGGAAYGFSQDSVAFSSIPGLPTNTSIVPTLNIYDLSAVAEERSVDSNGEDRFAPSIPRVVVMACNGVKTPFNQTLLFGNTAGIGIGYRINPSFVLMGYYGGDGMLDFAPPGSSLYMEAGGRNIALEGRYYPVSHIYGTAGVEYRTIATDSMMRTDVVPWQHIAGFSQSMVGLSAGVGFSTQGVFIEARQHWGLRQIRFANGLSQPVSNFALQWGINLEF